MKRNIKNFEDDIDGDNGSGDEGEDLEDFICNQTIRPSISEIHLGDYVIVEYLVPGNKKYFVGLVMNVLTDILKVTFLIKEAMDFTYPASNNASIVLPTQVVKVLPTPTEKKRGKLMFPKQAIQGFLFEKI